MLKITKPFRYANILKVDNKILNDKDLSINFKSNLSKLKYVPKNTLRAKFVRLDLGEIGDDFVRNVKSFRCEFEIIKFKR